MAGNKHRIALMGAALALSGMALVASQGGLPAAAETPATAASGGSPTGQSAGTCSLGPSGQIQHVIYMQFDNTHFSRDNPNVPSDIEQMPALLHFMEDNGTVLTNDHTPLIAHTADDLVTSQTGVYGDRQGIPEANSYQYYQPSAETDTAGSFGYWTDPVDSYSTADGLSTSDHSPNMIDASGQMAPAPWVPYTRAGCDFGSVAMANTELENTVPDIPDVFGANSPDAAEATANPDLAETQYEGLSVHCAEGSAVCAKAKTVPDQLPDEPGGYNGYQAVFGAKYLDPLFASDGQPTNLNGQIITDSKGNVGFPGYDGMQPANALAYTLDLQAAGVPVTYTYLTDAHDNATTGNGMGPGEPTYQAQLAAYNQAFATFFTRLAQMGITPANTLFVFGEDENDHYVGSPPSPSSCDGVQVTCSYGQLGEVGLNLQGLVDQEQGITTGFAVHSDAAPFVYLDGQPGRTTSEARTFGQALTRLTAFDPYQSKDVALTNYVADPVELQVLHMTTADPNRTPTFAMFANPDFYLSADGSSCSTANCETIESDVWNHGDIAPDINQSWMAFDGPGVATLGTSDLWASETDTRPTIMHVLGLQDDYQHEGVVLTPILDQRADTGALAGPNYADLAAAYTAIEQPVGAFGLDTLTASTKAIASDSPNDTTYNNIEAQIAAVAAERDQVGQQMINLLESAAFGGRPIQGDQAHQLEGQANSLLSQAQQLAQE
jgi:hypothetical protein